MCANACAWCTAVAPRWRSSPTSPPALPQRSRSRRCSPTSRRPTRHGRPVMAESPRTCVIAEDEALLRQALLDQLAQAWPQLQILAACEDGASAVEALAEHQPDVAFLDIRMPGLTGLDVAAASAQASPRTQIVFVTAYDQYAIDAFERGAIDYLLKPIAAERLAAIFLHLQQPT